MLAIFVVLAAISVVFSTTSFVANNCEPLTASVEVASRAPSATLVRVVPSTPASVAAL
jgi:hypothetical protein